MIFDGKQVAQEITKKLKEKAQKGDPKKLAVVMVGDNAVSTRYVKKKQKLGKEIGVAVELAHFVENTTQEEVEKKLDELSARDDVYGIIVQLPLPKHFDVDVVLSHIVSEKDVDALGPRPAFYSPMVEVVKEILHQGNVDLAGKRVVVVGQGKLVGKPITQWIRETEAKVEVANIDTKDLSTLTRDADVIISGAGVPRLITSYMVKEGVVLIDAGTSEEAGKLVGDIDPACAEKAALFTPVPGGVGPMTVVMLFKNILRGENQPSH